MYGVSHFYYILSLNIVGKGESFVFVCITNSLKLKSNIYISVVHQSYFPLLNGKWMSVFYSSVFYVKPEIKHKKLVNKLTKAYSTVNLY